jgi:hypothetical protein
MASNQNMKIVILAVSVSFLGFILACYSIGSYGRQNEGEIIGPAENPQTVAQCISPPEDYHWEFQNRAEDSGSRGSKCSAELVFENTSDQSQRWFFSRNQVIGILKPGNGLASVYSRQKRS